MSTTRKNTTTTGKWGGWARPVTPAGRRYAARQRLGLKAAA